MNLGELRQYCNFIVNKDQKGNPATPEDFIILVNAAVNKFFSSNYKDILLMSNEKGTPVSELVMNNNKMKRYVSEIQLSRSTDMPPTFALPGDTNFKHELSATAQDGSRPITNRRFVKILSNIQFDRFITNDLRDSLSEDVAAKYRPATKNFVLSSTFEYLYLSYIRDIINSAFDYCSDQFGNVYYMLPGYSVVSAGATAGATYNLVNRSGGVVVLNVTHPTATSYPHYSTSVELDVDEEYHEDIAKIVIIDMSIKDQDYNKTQIEVSKQ